MPYVSITGLQLKSVWSYPLFTWHAVRSMIQAKKADGNISADARKINGVYHTLSVWRDEDSMRNFLRSGTHKKAMGDFRKIASGKNFGYITDTIPNWSDVHQLWQEKSKAY